MSLIHEFERSGNLLFRYRGQIPVLFFVLSVPVVLLSDYTWLVADRALWLGLIAVIISFLGILIRAWTIGTTPAGTSGRNTREQVADALNTRGIYSLLRHPLYLGNYLMWAGMLLFTAHPWFILTVSLVYWIYYERIMFAEERFLTMKYPESYEEWAMRVPAIIPRFARYIRPQIPFSWRSVLRREYSGWLATAIGFAFIDQLRQYNLHGEFSWGRPGIYTLAAVAILALLLRSMKHYTRLLHEEGRS